MSTQGFSPIELIGDDELRRQINRLLSVRPPKRRTGPVERAGAAKPMVTPYSLSFAAAGLAPDLCQGIDALPHPILLAGNGGVVGNAALQAALHEERAATVLRRGPVRAEPVISEQTVFDTIQRTSPYGIHSTFFPLGQQVYGLQAVANEAEQTAIFYFLPIAQWAPRLPFSIRLAICFRLSGLPNKQLTGILGISERSAQHLSRYYKTELLALRRLVAKAKMTNTLQNAE